MPVKDGAGVTTARRASRHVGPRNRAGLLSIRRRTTPASLRHARPGSSRPVLRRVRPGRPRRAVRNGLVAMAAVLGLVFTVLAVKAPFGDDSGPVAGRGGNLGAASEPRDDDAVAGARSADPGGPVRVTSTGAMRIGVERLFGQHTLLTNRLARSRIRGDADLAQAADAALGRNAEAISTLIEPLYGAASARRFTSLWTSGVAAVFAYASGAADGDPAAMATARARLVQNTADLSGFLSGVTKGGVSKEPLEARLRQHSEDLLTQVDAYARGDYDTAYQVERDGYAHMVPVGKALAAALATRDDSLRADAHSLPRQLHSRLGMLLAEHAQLAVDTMRSRLAGWKELPAAAAVLDANSADLAAEIELVLEPRAAEQFAPLWADHIDALSAYTSAVADGDATGKSAAIGRMRAAAAAISRFFTSWTGGRVGGQSLVRALEHHDDILVKQIEAYHAQDYEGAQKMSLEAYDHMYVLADGLANGIAGTVAARMGRASAQTGASGATTEVGRP
jgi:hypothetical protein